MKRLLAFVCVTTLFIMGFAASAMGEWWHNKALKDKLELKEEQVQEMDRIMNAYQERRIEHTASAQKWRLKLNTLLSQEKLEKQAVDEAKESNGLKEAA